MTVGNVPSLRPAAPIAPAAAPPMSLAPVQREGVPLWLAYVVAVVAAGAVAAGDWFVPSVFAPFPFLLGALVVVIAALLGGLGPGLLATVLGAAAGGVLLVNSGATPIWEIGVQTGAFVAFGLLIAALSDARRHAMRRAAQAQGELRAVSGGLTDGVLRTDAAHRLVFANDAAARLVGFASGAALQQATMRALIERFEMRDLQGRPVPVESLRDPGAMRGEQDAEAVLEMRDRATGQTRWWSVNAIPLPPVKAGKPSATMTVFRDVTAQQQAETSLATSERRFRALIAHSADAFALLDARGGLLFTSPAVSHLLGYREETLRGADLYSLVHPHDIARTTALVAALRTADAPPTDRLRLRHQDGRWRWIEATGSDLTDDPSVRAALLNLHDITERKRAEETVAANERRFHALLDQTTEPIFVTDAAGNIVYTTPASERIFGYTPEPFAVTAARTPIHPGDQTSVREFFETVTATPDHRATIEYRMRHHDGAYRWVEMTATNLLHDPAVRGVIGTYRDITECRRAVVRQQFLRAANAQLVATDGDDDALAAVLGAAVPAFAIGCAVELRGGTGKLRRAFTVLPVEEMPDPFATTPVAAYIARALITGHAARFVPVAPAAPAAPAQAQAKGDIGATDPTDPLALAMLVAPLIVRGMTLGAVTLAVPADAPFDEADQTTAEEFVGRLALALAHTRLTHEGQETESRYRHLLASIADAVVVADGAGQIMDANPAFTALVGYTAAEVRQMGLAALVAVPEPADGDDGEAVGATAFAGAWQGEAVVTGKDGARVPVEGRVIPMPSVSANGAASLSIWRAMPSGQAGA